MRRRSRKEPDFRDFRMFARGIFSGRTEIRDAILANVGTTISFRVGLADAEVLEKEFYPEFSASDLTNLPNFHIYLRLMIDRVVSKAFRGETIRQENP